MMLPEPDIVAIYEGTATKPFEVLQQHLLYKPTAPA